MTPDYLICLECETPTYIFEWRNGTVREALCSTCGNDDPSQFITEEDYEAMSLDERLGPTRHA
jgi:hypothetical protein